MPDTQKWSDEQRLSYVRAIATEALFTDKERTNPKYSVEGGLGISSSGWRIFHAQFSGFVNTNLSNIERISDQRWRRLTRAQFAILDQELLDEAFKPSNVANAILQGKYEAASEGICHWLKENGYCISASSRGGPFSTFVTPTLPRGGGTPTTA